MRPVPCFTPSGESARNGRRTRISSPLLNSQQISCQVTGTNRHRRYSRAAKALKRIIRATQLGWATEIVPGSRVVAEASSAITRMRSCSHTVYTPVPPTMAGTIGTMVSFRMRQPARTGRWPAGGLAASMRVYAHGKRPTPAPSWPSSKPKRGGYSLWVTYLPERTSTLLAWLRQLALDGDWPKPNPNAALPPPPRLKSPPPGPGSCARDRLAPHQHPCPCSLTSTNHPGDQGRNLEPVESHLSGPRALPCHTRT